MFKRNANGVRGNRLTLLPTPMALGLNNFSKPTN